MHNKFYSKSLFQEARFLFNEGAGDKPAAEAIDKKPAPKTVEGPVKPDDKKAEVKKEAKEDLAKLGAEAKLDDLKKALEDRNVSWVRALEAMRIQSKGLDGLIAGFQFEDAIPSLSGKIHEQLEKRSDDLKVVTDVFAEDVEKPLEVVATVMAARFVEQGREQFNTMFRYFDKFPRDKEYGEMKYAITAVRGGTVEFRFDVSPDFKKDYQAFVKENKDKLKDDSNKKSPEQPESKEQLAVELANSKVGRMLTMFLGYKPLKPGDKIEESDFYKVVSGQDWLAGLMLGMFGYKKYVGESFDKTMDMVSSVSPKMGVAMGKFQERAKTSSLYAKGEDLGLIEKAEGLLADFKSQTIEWFDGFLSGTNKMPEAGFKLAEGRDLGGKTLKVDLSVSGAEAVLPKGTNYREGSGPTKAVGEEPVTLTAGVVELTNLLKDTAFKGPVKFVVPEKEATA